jgi:hypothetical protein
MRSKTDSLLPFRPKQRTVAARGLERTRRAGLHRPPCRSISQRASMPSENGPTARRHTAMGWGGAMDDSKGPLGTERRSIRHRLIRVSSHATRRRESPPPCCLSRREPMVAEIGQTLMRAGELGQEMFILISGEGSLNRSRALSRRTPAEKALSSRGDGYTSHLRRGERRPPSPPAAPS